MASDLVRRFPGKTLKIPKALPEPSELPDNCHPILRDIAESCGADVAITLVAHYAGQVLYIPAERYKATHRLVQTLGQDLADELVFSFGGDRIIVPRFLSRPNPGSRRDRILNLLRAGMKVREIAAEAGCTTARVYQIIAAERARTGRNPREPVGVVVPMPAQNETENVSVSKTGPGTVVPFKDGGW